mmetsp:Transcript_16940/g.48291  ORF Transcript_16940/g.48291 Transcript_16940/m.48291 type:complete len:262 (-) Transcript_16940:972-1757(-)
MAAPVSLMSGVISSSTSSGAQVKNLSRAAMASFRLSDLMLVPASRHDHNTLSLTACSTNREASSLSRPSCSCTSVRYSLHDSSRVPSAVGSRMSDTSALKYLVLSLSSISRVSTRSSPSPMAHSRSRRTAAPVTPCPTEVSCSALRRAILTSRMYRWTSSSDMRKSSLSWLTAPMSDASRANLPLKTSSRKRRKILPPISADLARSTGPVKPTMAPSLGATCRCRSRLGPGSSVKALMMYCSKNSLSVSGLAKPLQSKASL